MSSKFARLFAMQWQTVMQYRTDLILWVTVETAGPLVSLAIWYTVASSTAAGASAAPAAGTAPVEVFTYYILIMFIIIAANAWNGFFLAEEIRNGTLAQYLVKPMSVFTKHITANLSEKIIKLAIPLPLFLIALAAAPHWFAPAIYNPAHIALFAVSLGLAAVLSFIIDLNFGLLAFWLEDTMQIRRYNDLLREVTSGILIPFAFLPLWAQSAFSFLPFRYIFSAPAEIILGQAEGAAALNLLSLQAAWLIAAAAAAVILWRQGLKTYVPAGN